MVVAKENKQISFGMASLWLCPHLFFRWLLLDAELMGSVSFNYCINSILNHSLHELHCQEGRGLEENK